MSQMGCSGLGREVHPGHLAFFFFILYMLVYLEKGYKKRSVHGLCGETELLESWAHILSPAAVSSQLFMLQMDETVVSAGQGRGSALLMQYQSAVYGKEKCFLHRIFVTSVSLLCYLYTTAKFCCTCESCTGQFQCSRHINQMCKFNRC